jgi:hypothetical protein
MRFAFEPVSNAGWAGYSVTPSSTSLRDPIEGTNR